MRKFFTYLFFIFLCANVVGQVHTTYLWHLQQPIYWPEQSTWTPGQYQDVWESQYLKNNGGNIYPDGLAHPLNDLEEIFGKDDRKAVYQWRTKDAVQTLLGLPDAGAQVNYSGCLIENVNSLAVAGQLGYSTGWQNNFQTARNWQTSGGNPRLDVVGFTFHHAIAPLVSERVLAKEIQTHRYIYQQNFGTSPAYSKGFWPAECSFSERIIKVLAEEGFEWSVIANSHLARTLSDYPLSFGTSGCNIDPPNGADVVTTMGSNWWSGQIDGRGGTFAAPYCYQAHKAQYIDPETGEIYKVTVVPMDDVLSYMNGYALMGTGEIDAHIAPFDNPEHPSIVLMAHDGDNAWGGGYDYYQNSVPQFAQAAANQGYIPTTVQQFLSNNPVPANDVVRVEDGSWVNAANDWGHPQFINWNWPMYTQNYEFNPEGWTEDARNWAVLVAAENFVIMAEDLAGTPTVADVVEPGSGASAVAKAWHHLLPGYTSGYMYYGTSLDMEVKQSLAANIAVDYANMVISANPGTDNTPPSVFIPQRYPYNPGGTGFGPTYGYQQHQNSSDFTIWTFAYDVSGLENVVLKYRTDEDGINPLDDPANDIYAGGAGVGEWQTLAMESRLFPAGNVTNNPDIDFFIMPDHIAYQYWAEITGLSETLVDYYVEAADVNGNIFKTPIQHVYVGTNSLGGQGDVTWTPEAPDNEDLITIVINNATQGGNLHWGVNGFNQPIEAYWPQGTFLVNETGPAVETPFIGPTGDDQLVLQIGPFNNPGQEVNNVSFVIHYNDDTWDNNNGQDYIINLGPGGTDIIQWSPSEPMANETITITVNQATVSGKLHWGVNGWNNPNPAYWTEGSYLFGGTGPAIQSPMEGPNAENQLTLQIGPFNNPIQEVSQVNFVISFDDGNWNNNNGQDYLINILPAQEAGSLKGAIINANNSQFLTGALISASDGIFTYSATSTGEQSPGINYIIENIPPGIYNVNCSKNGFETISLSDIEILNNETTVANFSMVPNDYPLPPGWDFNFTPVSHNISIPEGFNPTFNYEPLDYGDYIGLFYENDEGISACAGAIQFQWEETVITAFGDDSFTPEKDGLNVGDPLVWKIYHQASQADFPATVSYNSTFPQADGLFYPNGLSQVLTLEASSYITQSIMIPAGWSGISSFVNPLNKNVEAIFAPFINDFVIMSSATALYYPETGTNTIQNWNYHTGYKIKMLSDITLELTGEKPNSPTVNLDSGWNLIPVLTTCGTASQELSSQLAGLKIIKGIATTDVYWPEYNIQTLGQLEAGKSYWLSTDQDDTLTYPDCNTSPSAGNFTETTRINSPWNDVVFTGSTHLIVLPSEVISASGLISEDLIGMFTEGEICAGISEIGNPAQNIAFIAFADDETTTETEGFADDEIIQFRLYRPSVEKEALLDVEFENEKPHQGNFAMNGISAIKSISINSTGFENISKNTIRIFPNPTTGIFNIQTEKLLADLEIIISDTHGRILDNHFTMMTTTIMSVDISDQPEGIYFIKIITEEFTFAGKILMIN
ncbi:MAG: T9SS type A sorting domain-containing protein [Bacteroidales bacterium]|nr:T9SS type A sorting domain-containing protein [Bacteroidales bacterium]